MARPKLLDEDATLALIESLPAAARAKVENIVRCNLYRMGKHLQRQNRGMSNTRWGRTWAAYRRRVASDIAAQRVNLDDVILDDVEDGDDEYSDDFH